MKVVGVVPMAGRATRLSEISCSKEILPVEPPHGAYNDGEGPRAVCEYLLAKMHDAGVGHVNIILREGKRDNTANL